MYQKYRSQLFREICLFIWAENHMALSPSLGLFIGPIPSFFTFLKIICPKSGFWRRYTNRDLLFPISAFLFDPIIQVGALQFGITPDQVRVRHPQAI